MNRLPFAAFVVASLSIGCMPSMARAQKLYGITMTGTQLITIDTATGAGTLVGSSPVGLPFGIAFRGSKLYSWDQLAKKVLELNPATGAVVNSIDIGSAAQGEGDIVFRSDGMGFLTPQGVLGQPPFQFVRFDITAGTSTALGAGTGLSINGMAYSPSSGVLYAVDQGTRNLYTINDNTGATTLIGPTGIGLGFAYGGLAFDSSGVLYMSVSGVSPGSDLYKVSPATGIATKIGAIGFDRVCGLAYGGGPATPGATITQSAGSTNVTEGGATDSYTVVLNTAPTGNVTITINPGTQVAVTPATTLTFTPANWNMPQTVTVTAIDDALAEGPHTGTITHTAASADVGYNGIAIASVVVNITDNDVGLPPPPAPPIQLSGPREGTIAGSRGPSGREGGYGLGGGMAREPILQGPDGARVFNVAHRSSGPTANESTAVLAWSAMSAMVLLFGVGALFARRA